MSNRTAKNLAVKQKPMKELPEKSVVETAGERPRYADRIKRGLQESIEYLQGNRDLQSKNVAALPKVDYSGPEISGIREKIGCSQAAFATLMGVSPEIVQNWERGLRRPSGPAMRLLQVLGEPDEFKRLVESVVNSKEE